MKKQGNETINTITFKEEKNMKRRIAILTRSKKNEGMHKGYCVAGINVDTNEWVRLKRMDSSTLREEHITTDTGYECRELDVVEVECLDEPSGRDYQPENIYVNPDVPFKHLYRTTWADIISRGIEVKDENGMILGSVSYRETLYQVSKLKDKTSLQLIKVSDLTIFNDPCKVTNDSDISWKVDRIKASFTYQGQNKYYFSVTDRDYLELAKEKDIYIPSAYLVVSRGEPFTNSRSKCTYHYSIVAKIIENREVSMAA